MSLLLKVILAWAAPVLLHAVCIYPREEEKEEVVKGPITIEQIQKNIERENRVQVITTGH